MNWTPAQVAAAERRIAVNMTRPLVEAISPERLSKLFPAQPTPRGMNRWESLYHDELEMRRLAGEICWFAFEPMRLKLADFTIDGKPRSIRYTPDFAALEWWGPGKPDPKVYWRLVFFEVKGHWREAARVRIKLAASQYPFRFVAVTREKCEWKCEEFGQ